MVEAYPTTQAENAELKNKVVEGQTSLYKDVLERLVDRSDVNTDLVNSMLSFLQSLERRSSYGDSEARLSEESVQKLTEFFNESAKNLDGLVGNRRV
ncbi:TPA: hypothetical protein DCQ44_01140 [Candidatus Taylorbacteria bacterium]|nr:hypothetical protein [Candidatus Taylorbacteria bacterium]